MTKPRATPAMTSDKAIAATIASLVCSIVLSIVGVMPTTEEMLAADMQELVVNVAGYAALIFIPSLAAYFKRNKLK